jgi:L-threonylcarbamoyladenylate synthase
MRVLPFRTPEDHARASDIANRHLQAGGLLAYPTETVYGYGCAVEPAPLAALATFKGGRAEKSFLLLIANPHQVSGLRWTDAARSLAAAFWPGPLTIALAIESATFPAEVVSPSGTIAVRVSPHPGLQELLRRFGRPITSTSANLAQQEPARSATAVQGLLTSAPLSDSFLLLDGGELEPSLPSTLVDCSETVPRVLRAGAISVDQLKRCVDELRS